MTDTTLITLTGANQPNAEAQIMQGLAQLNIKLIDTQIANTNGHLVLGLRVAHEGALELSAITAVAESLGLAVQTTQINVEEQDAWLAQESTPAYIVTLMGREVTAQANSSVMALIAEHGLQVTSTKRLSAPDAVARVGYEFTVVG
ncbi:MAG: ACT domain-containing protein, partial [Pontibacterium sp.]